MMRLISHDQPRQSLFKHLSGVLEMATKSLYYHDIAGWNRDELMKAVSIVAVFHDFAKATSYFQDYIVSKKKDKSLKSSHTMLSAIVSYFVAKKILKGGEEDVLLSSLFIFMVVRRHHGNILEFKSVLASMQDRQNLLLEQARSIRYEHWNEIFQLLLPMLPFSIKNFPPLSIDTVMSWVNEFYEEIDGLRRWLRERYDSRRTRNSVQDYFRYCILYSLLLDGDKNQAALRDMMYHSRQNIPSNIVAKYNANAQWPISIMNELRKAAYQEVESNLQLINGNLLSINLPTGMGKTITSFNAALKLRERREQERGVAPRIIYALPFLSVIDQNYEVFERILSTTIDSFDYRYMIKHHSLVDPHEQTSRLKNLTDDDTEYDFDQAQILIEGWNSEIICTTFVQVFQTLISNRNRSLRRFHRFSNSILVLDEIQAIPVKYWGLMRAMLIELTNSMNTDVILLTATEPKIFEYEDNIQSLVNREYYFSKLNRVSIIPNIKVKQTINDFVQSLDLMQDKTYLFILNTIDSAKKLHRQLEEKTGEKVGFLSTHIVPYQRLARIKSIQNRQYRIVVSTQLVEAGVDIDFDIVYRDIAPLDSINQSAGRCNRNNLREGKLFVVNLCNEKTKRSFSRSIYSEVALSITETILGRQEIINEPQLLELIEQYFDEVKLKSKSESASYLNSVQTLYFSGEADKNKRIPISDFTLIEEDYMKFDIFVEIDERAQDIWSQFCDIMESENPLERYKNFSRLKKAFQDYVISVPAHTKHLPPLMYDQIGYVSNYSMVDYYDEKTGFISEGTMAIW